MSVKVAEFVQFTQINLQLAGDGLASIADVVVLVTNLCEKAKELIDAVDNEDLTDADEENLNTALNNVKKANEMLTTIKTNVGSIKDTITQTLPGVPSPTTPTEPSATLPEPAVTPLPEIEVPVVITPTDDSIGLPGSSAIDFNLSLV